MDVISKEAIMCYDQINTFGCQIKPVALVVIELCLSKGIGKSVSYLVSIKKNLFKKFRRLFKNVLG